VSQWELIGDKYVNKRSGRVVSRGLVDRVYGVLGEEWMTLREISRLSGYSYAAVFSAVEVLKEMGIVERRKREGAKGWLWRRRV